MSRRIVFINRFFYPDHSATSQLLSDLAFHLATRNHQVNIITSRLLYDNTIVMLPKYENIADVNIHRVYTTRCGRVHLIGRLLDYLSFYISAAVRLWQLVHRNDVIVVKTDPPLLSLLVWTVIRFRHVTIINWLQDIYPEIAVVHGMRVLRGPLGKMIRLLRNRSLKRAYSNIVISSGMRQKLLNTGIPANLIQIIPNWVNDEMIKPIDTHQNILRREWNLEEKFVVGYSGNLGHAHDIETVLGAIRNLQNRPDICFLFVGGGRGFSELEEVITKQSLNNVIFKPYQLHEILALSLTLPDLHWVSLRPEMEGLVVPSKFYGIAAAGRPVLLIADEEGDLSRLVKSYHCGRVISPGDSDALVEDIIALEANRGLCEDMGLNARKLLEMTYSRSRALAQWEEVLNVAIV